MSQDASKGGTNDASDPAVMFMIALLVFGGGYLIWTTFHTQIVQVFIGTRTALLYLVPTDLSAAYRTALSELSPETVQWDGFMALLNDTGLQARFPVFVGLMGWAVFLYMKAYTTRFSKQHSIQSLITQEQVLWPEIAPVVDRGDLVKADPREGPWASAMTEREFAKAHGLITPKGDLDEVLAQAVFARQVGPLLPANPMLLPPVIQGMSALMVLRIAGHGDEALKEARRLAQEYAQGGVEAMDFGFAKTVWKTHGGHEWVVRAAQKHRYVYPWLATLLQLSRQDGVWASPLWIWLKPVDRRAFYTLNAVGRYAHFSEVAGIISHWKAEKKFGCPCAQPEVAGAVEGLKKALAFFCDDDELERIFK
jgi:intracellular multiplication protein IcmP